MSAPTEASKHLRGSKSSGWVGPELCRGQGFHRKTKQIKDLWRTALRRPAGGGASGVHLARGIVQIATPGALPGTDHVGAAVLTPWRAWSETDGHVERRHELVL